MKTLIEGVICFSEDDNKRTADIRRIHTIKSYETEVELEEAINPLEDEGIDWLCVEEYDGTITYEREK